MNENYVKKAEKIISQFSEKLSDNIDKKANFVVDNRSYFITDDHIREKIFNKNLNIIDIHGLVFKIIDNQDEVWIRKCVPDKKRMNIMDLSGSFESQYANLEREFISDLPYFFTLKKLKKFKAADKKTI
ncbi:hypothetical protein [Campylobacter blaseri]|uniref:hypothetical protein n=1 Tax=Campylobacter blaseri TaxID=2042961 RepID=UPI001F4E8A61|nr:hypothetical protein [Campylobacter blaseri]